MNWYRKKEPLDTELSFIADAFKKGKALTRLPCNDFVGTICCADSSAHGHLTKPNRSYQFGVGNDGLFQMSQYTEDKDKCLFVGFPSDWLQCQISNGIKFQLLLFPRQTSEYAAVWCSWDNLFDLFREQYNGRDNNVYQRIEPFMNALKDLSFEEITKDADFDFGEVEGNGESDPNYMSFKRFVSIPVNEVTLVQARLFLFCWLDLNELFEGDGYTKDEHGKQGCREYIIPNMHMHDIPNLHIVPLSIKM